MSFSVLNSEKTIFKIEFETEKRELRILSEVCVSLLLCLFFFISFNFGIYVCIPNVNASFIPLPLGT